MTHRSRRLSALLVSASVIVVMSGCGGRSDTTTPPSGCHSTADCDDGVFCNGVETCADGACVPGTTPACEDGIGCTTDLCDVDLDACVHRPSDTRCSDGLFCNGAERCDPGDPGADPVSGCRAAAAPPDCDDGIACTVDSCNDSTSKCDHVPLNAVCDDQVFCNGTEVCDPMVGCRPGTPRDCSDGLSCTEDTCSDDLAACIHAPVHSACGDGLGCTGQETCSVTGQGPTGCVAGTPIVCAPDGVSCTVDACTEATVACASTPDHGLCPAAQLCVVPGGCVAGAVCDDAAQCQDGDACNGVEVCTNKVCQPGSPVSCDDGIPCTIDACDPGTGQCAHTPNDAACSDGLACNGVETCNPSTGCVAGAAVNCDDGIPCTVDGCLEPSGTCTHGLDHAYCSDGQLCNGSEVCDPVLGCKPGAPFVCPRTGVACSAAVCDPELNACKPAPDDDLCPAGQTCDAVLGCGHY